MIADNHNHFLMAGDIDLILGAAADAPIDEIVFSEHVFNITEARQSIDGLDRIRPEGSALSHGEYLRTVHHAAERAAIPVRVGMELDVRPDEPEFERQIEAFVGQYGDAWDVAIGSVHTINGHVSVHALPPTSADEAWEDYLDRQLAATPAALTSRSPIESMSRRMPWRKIALSSTMSTRIMRAVGSRVGKRTATASPPWAA